MARIKNIELPKDKALYIGLTAIYGVGQSTAKKICAEAKIDPEMKVRDLTTEQEALLRTEVDKFVVEGEKVEKGQSLEIIDYISNNIQFAKVA